VGGGIISTCTESPNSGGGGKGDFSVTELSNVTPFKFTLSFGTFPFIFAAVFFSVENSSNSVKTVARDQNKNIISTGKDRAKVFSSASQTPNGNLKNNSSSLTKSKENGVTSLKPIKDMDVIKENKTSIRDRIAKLFFKLPFGV
jgi:hypothetical protein